LYSNILLISAPLSFIPKYFLINFSFLLTNHSCYRKTNPHKDGTTTQLQCQPKT
jgi:hypothetical protein